MKVTQNDESYNKYVDAITPKHSCLKNCLHAFIIGGGICTLGQLIHNICISYFNLSEKDSSSWTSVTLILFSVLLTGFNLYKPLTKYGGAGTLVPITGFANSVASPAIEYQKEGEVYGKGVKIFSIAGPVILFGILSSFLIGVIYIILQQLNII